jgi:mRNA-degrading endonuclease toxin of MazEF toxin-antitoxin module
LKVNQRDIVEVNFQLPGGIFKPHPVLVVSNENVYEQEEIFYALLISSKQFNTEFEIEISDDMLLSPLHKRSFVKCQLLQAYTTSEILKRITSMKKDPFELIINKFFNSVFK